MQFKNVFSNGFHSLLYMLIILIYFLIFILKIEWNKYAAEGQQQGLKMFDCFVCIWWSCEYQLIAYKYLILIIFCFTESWTFSLYIYNQFTKLYTNNQKVMNKQLVLTLLLCAAVLSQSNNCPSFFGGDLLQSARNTIMRGPVDGSPERQYQTFFNFKAPANRNIQIAITTSTIGDYNPLPSYGYNYIVTAARKENSNAIIYKLFMENNNAWSTIQVSLLISGRQDLAIGNFQVPIQQWSLGSANVYSISYTVNKYLPGGPFKVAAFISGFSTTDSQFALTIVKKSYDEKAKTVDVGFFCSANPAVLTLSIAYVVYPEVHSVFQITYDLTPRAQTGSYQLAGPVNFQPNKRIQYNEWRVENRNLVCTGNQCQGNNCILRQNCAQLNGNVYQGQCVFCSPGVIFEFGRCSRKCGPNQLYIRQACACTTGYQRKGISCVKKASCGNNEVYSNDQKKCICRTQSYRVGTECINCPVGAIGTPDGLSCTCNAPGKIFKPALNICVDRCLQFQLWGDNRCQCINSYSWWNQGCRKCPDDAVPTVEQTSCICRNPNSFYDAERNLCVVCGPYSTLNGFKNGCICDFGYQLVNGVCNQIRPKCPPGQIQQNSQCICEKGFADYGSCKKCPANTFTNTQRTRCICADPNSIFRADSFQCVSCPANSRPNDILTLCVCNHGFTQEGQNCILKCGLNEIATEFGTCACIGGYYKPAGGVCQPRCPANQDWNGQRCICKPGYVQRNGGCTLCPVNAIPNQFRSSCLCQIPGYIFDKSTFQCVKCPDYSYNSDDDTKCLCNAGYSYIDNVCSPICGLNQALNTKTNKCECKYGFLNLGGQCVERCGLNQQWNGFECLCKSNTIKATGACRPCGENLYTNPKRTTCLCSNPKFLFNLNKFLCDPLPDYSSPNEDYTDFICYAGYRRDGYRCANPCPNGAFPDASGTCVCTGGLFLINNQCQKPATCPPGSSWNNAKLQCQCNVKGQFLIDGQCTQCGLNSIYIPSSKQCVCTTGFFLIGGECVICDPKSRYNGTDCVCNLGYYGTRDQCNKCHQSCSICSGPEANQCQACSDVSLVLQKGFCSKNSPCDPGLFLYEDTCTKCSDNCIICESNFDCKTCAVGYKIEKLELEDQKVQICVELCGDGIKYQDECDDGNYNDGDGCSSTCRVQSGWTCEGGSSAKKSRCNKYIPDQTILIEKGSVNLGDKVVQSVRASYLPTCLTKNECAQCFKAIKVNVVDANVPILVKVSYVPFSQYQYLIEYNFQGLIVTSKFKAVIKLNELYKGCLADDDYNQQLEVEIDPAFLAQVEVTQQLQFGDISLSKSKQPVIQVPSAAKKILGLSN